MLFTTSYSISFLIVSVLSFLIFVKHIRKVTDPFVDPGLGKKYTFMIGVLCGGIIFGTVAGFVSMVPYMMKDVHQLSTAEIGSVIIFPGTMSVIIFGYIGGILVDRRGPLYVLNIGVTFLSVSFFNCFLSFRNNIMVHDNYNRICFRWAFVHQNSYINNCFK